MSQTKQTKHSKQSQRQPPSQHTTSLTTRSPIIALVERGLRCHTKHGIANFISYSGTPHLSANPSLYRQIVNLKLLYIPKQAALSITHSSALSCPTEVTPAASHTDNGITHPGGRVVCPAPAADAVVSPLSSKTSSRAQPLLLWLPTPCETRHDVAMDVRIVPLLLSMSTEGFGIFWLPA